jgi:hypothetical protein
MTAAMGRAKKAPMNPPAAPPAMAAANATPAFSSMVFGSAAG